MQYRLLPIVPFIVCSTAVQASTLADTVVNNPNKGMSIEIPLDSWNQIKNSLSSLTGRAGNESVTKLNLTTDSNTVVELQQVSDEELIANLHLTEPTTPITPPSEPVSYSRYLDTLAGLDATLVFNPVTSTLTASVSDIRIIFDNLFDSDSAEDKTVFHSVAEMFSERSIQVIWTVLSSLEALPLADDLTVYLPTGTLSPTEEKNTFVFELNQPLVSTLYPPVAMSPLSTNQTQCFNLGTTAMLHVTKSGRAAIVSDPYNPEEPQDMDGQSPGNTNSAGSTGGSSGQTSYVANSFGPLANGQPPVTGSSGGDGRRPSDGNGSSDRTPDDYYEREVEEEDEEDRMEREAQEQADDNDRLLMDHNHQGRGGGRSNHRDAGYVHVPQPLQPSRTVRPVSNSPSPSISAIPEPTTAPTTAPTPPVVYDSLVNSPPPTSPVTREISGPDWFGMTDDEIRALQNQ